MFYAASSFVLNIIVFLAHLNVKKLLIELLLHIMNLVVLIFSPYTSVGIWIKTSAHLRNYCYEKNSTKWTGNKLATTKPDIFLYFI